MNKILFFLILTLFPFHVGNSWQHIIPHKFFYVSPNGSDENNGTLEQPVASFEGAQNLVRRYKSKNQNVPVTVYFRDGKYYRTQSAIYTTEDNGTKKAPVAYKAYPGENPLILGGKQLQLKWEKHKDGIFKVKVPQGLIFESLFVDDEEQVLARYPDYDPNVRTFNGTADDCISEERVKNWKNPVDGYFHVIHGALWGGFHFRITGKDKKGELTMEGGWQNNRPENGLHKRLRYVENIFEELDAEKEWYLDRNTSMLYFKPARGVDLQNANVEVACLENFIKVLGTEQEPVRYLSFDGFTFSRTVRTFMKTKDRLLRSDWTIYRGGAVYFEGTEYCSVRNCTFYQIGGNAFFANAYNRNVLVEGNHIHHIGASGICFVGDTTAVRNALYEAYGPPTKEENLDHTIGSKNNRFPANCVADNNLIHDIGRVEKQVAGIQISVAMDITVSHNSIYDCPRAGINVGEGAFGGHLFEFNDVFNTVLETSDHGSFNSWGRDRFWMAGNQRTEEIVGKYPQSIFYDLLKPTVIRNNRMSCDHGWDIDLDDGSSYYEIYNNLCLKNGIKLREGYYRKVENNICVNNSIHPHVWLKDNNDIIRGNIFGNKFFPIRVNHWGREVDFNWYTSQSYLKETQKFGIEQNSMAGDPQFVDPKNGDFRIKSTSEVFKLGWKNFPMDQFGVQKEELKKLTKQPEIPALQVAYNTNGIVHGFYGGQIKNLETDGEISATGMHDKVGVYVLKSPVYGNIKNFDLKPGDVILKVGNTEVKNVDFFLGNKKLFEGDKLKSITVWRDQKILIIE